MLRMGIPDDISAMLELGSARLSALGFALCWGKYPMARLLLSAGASPFVEHPLSDGEMSRFKQLHAIHILADFGAKEEVAWLLEKYPHMVEEEDKGLRVVRLDEDGELCITERSWDESTTKAELDM
jgi:hypothetical protein